jgi:hypothetical protein
MEKRRSIMKCLKNGWMVLGFFLLIAFWLGGEGKGSAGSAHHGSHATGSFQDPVSPLAQPGNDIFGAVQEVIRKLDADPGTDWSKVDLEALRRHLIDMHHVALHVEIVSRTSLEKGVALVIRGMTPQAEASLSRVLAAHPEQLLKETGWTMAVKKIDAGYELKVTGLDLSDAVKIRGLSYIGLLAYGKHHQPHHWAIATGSHPHSEK